MWSEARCIEPKQERGERGAEMDGSEIGLFAGLGWSHRVLGYCLCLGKAGGGGAQ